MATSCIYITLPKVGNIFHGGLWGNFAFFVGSNWNFCFWPINNVVRHISCKFHLEIRSNKKIITNNSLTNQYEIHSNIKYTVNWISLLLGTLDLMIISTVLKKNICYNNFSHIRMVSANWYCAAPRGCPCHGFQELLLRHPFSHTIISRWTDRHLLPVKAPIQS